MHTNLYFSVKTRQRHRGIPVQECCYKSTQSIYEMHVIIFHLHYQLIRQISICDIGYYKSRLGRIHTWYECNTAYLCEIIISECLQNRNYLGIITNGLTLATHPHLQVSFSSLVLLSSHRCLSFSPGSSLSLCAVIQQVGVTLKQGSVIYITYPPISIALFKLSIRLVLLAVDISSPFHFFSYLFKFIFIIIYVFLKRDLAAKAAEIATYATSQVYQGILSSHKRLDWL